MKELIIITVQGVKSYRVGDKMFGTNDVIDVIKIHQLHFTGDPYDHYCGFDKNGKMLFSVNCLVPCEIIY